MAVVPRPLADAPPRGRARVIHAGLAVVLLLAASAEALDVRLDAYREARRDQAMGVVAGRAVAEPRTLREAGLPFTGTTVTVLPRSEALVARLEQLKARSRESSAAFTGAVPAMRRARDGYERELWDAGATDLTTTMLVDTDGAFRLADVPAGDWLVMAWHSVPVDISGEKFNTKERGLYRARPRLRGFQSVTIWLRTVTVAPGDTTSLDLTDRNAWFRGVIEERMLDTGR